MPQSIIIDISKIKIYPKNGFNFLGIRCLYESSSNPKTIQILISDTINGGFFAHLGTFKLLMKSGTHIFQIKYNNDYIFGMRNKIKLFKIIVKETYGSNQTYINNIMFYEKIIKKNKINNNEINKSSKNKKLPAKKNILKAKTQNCFINNNKKKPTLNGDILENLFNKRITTSNKIKLNKINIKKSKEKKSSSNSYTYSKEHSGKFTEFSENSENSSNEIVYINGTFNGKSKNNTIENKIKQISPINNLDKQIYNKIKKKILIHKNTSPNKLCKNYQRNFNHSNNRLPLKKPRNYLYKTCLTENDFNQDKNLLKNKLNLMIQDSNSSNENSNSMNYRKISFKFQKTDQLNETKKYKNFLFNKIRKNKTNLYSFSKYNQFLNTINNTNYKKNEESNISNENTISFPDFITIGQYIDSKIEKISDEIEKRIIEKITNNSIKKPENKKNSTTCHFYDKIEKLHFKSKVIKKNGDKRKNISNKKNK